jgi:hypothetical protein
MGASTTFTVGDLHVYASCSPYTDNNFAPGKLNCNPAKRSRCVTSGALLSGNTAYKGTISFGKCADKQLFTIFHLGL